MHERTPLRVRLVARPTFRRFAGPFLCTTHHMYDMTGVSTPPFGRKGSCSAKERVPPSREHHGRACSAGLLGGRRYALGHLSVGEREVARRHVPARLLVEQRLLDGAHLLALPTARMESAGGRRVGRARHVAAEHLAPALPAR